MPSTKLKTDFTKLKARFAKHHQQAAKNFHQHHPKASLWLKKRQLDIGNIRAHSDRLLTGASLSTALLLSAPISPKTLPPPTAKTKLAKVGISPSSKIASYLLEKIKPHIPKRIGHLDDKDQAEVAAIIKKKLGLTAVANFQGQKLNHSLGWIGYEQHLKRFPGDSINQHDAQLQAGIAPGLGAWGYFASSKKTLTSDLIQKEKYYVAVQTLYLPTWKKDLKFLRDWYQYRKVLVLDVDSGLSVVAVVADAGPAQSTGKQFGGSPEVMQALDLTGKKSKGKVLILFIDDSQNKVPLGPIKSKIDEATILT